MEHNVEQLKKEIKRLKNGIYEMDYFLSFGETEEVKLETDDEVDEFIEYLINPELSEIESYTLIINELKSDFDDIHIRCVEDIKNALEWMDDEIKSLEDGTFLDEEYRNGTSKDYYEDSLYFNVKTAYKSSNTFTYYLDDRIEVYCNKFLNQGLVGVDGIDEYDELYEELQSKIEIINDLYEDYIITEA